jgi:hypothetical protein
MKGWREILSFKKEEDKFTPYKTENGVEIPNNAEFTGDKVPKSGDPAKKELEAWREGDKISLKDRNKEHKSPKGTPLLFEGYELTPSSTRKSWRNVFSDVSFKQKPDGTVAIDVSYNNTNAPTQEEHQWEQEQQGTQTPPASTEPPETDQTPLQEKEGSRKLCSDGITRWVIQKKGSMELLGKECPNGCGIEIKKEGSVVEDYKVDRNGREWRELINQAVWEARFDELTKN